MSVYTYSIIITKTAPKNNRNIDFPGFKCNFFCLSVKSHWKLRCIGAWTAIWKHSDSVEGLFPSYASMWMSQVMHRDLPYLHQTCYVPVNMIDTISQILSQIKKKIGVVDFNDLSELELHDILMKYTDCSDKRAIQISYILLKPKSVEDLQEETDDGVFFSEENLEEDVLSKIQSEEIVKVALSGLMNRERTIIEKRYGLVDGVERTLEELGLELSLTRERVRQIENKAKKKIAVKLYAKKMISHDQFLSAVQKCGIGRKKT